MDNGFNNGMNMGGMNQTPMNAPDYMLWLILGIIQICLVCCCSFPTAICGIITVIAICSANTWYKSGNIGMYQAKLKTAKLANIIGWALMIIIFVVNIVGGIFEAVFALFK